MSENDLNEINNQCRTCAEFKTVSNMHSIFDEGVNEFYTLNAYLAGFLFEDMKIKNGDGMSKYICGECHDTMKIIKSFFERCEKSQHSLRKVIIVAETKPDIEFLSVEKLEYIDPEIAENADGSDGSNVADFQDSIEYDFDENESDAEDKECSFYECNLCGKKFKKEYGLKTHISTQHTKKTIQTLKQTNGSVSLSENVADSSSDQQSKTSLSESLSNNTESELKTNNAIIRWECPICHKYYEKKNTLHIHLKRIHGMSRTKIGEPKILSLPKESSDTIKFTCDICGKHFEKKNTLYIHKKRIHTSSNESVRRRDATQECDICEKTFETKNSFYIHKMRFHGIKKHECPYCNAKYNSDDKFRRHLKIHNKTCAKHQCKYCLKSCLDLEDLESHEKTHAGSKPYLCTTCGTLFTQRQHLNRHLRIHTGEKKYKCGFCGMEFLHEATYRHHRRTHELTPKTYQCEHCGKHFNRRTGLNCHLVTHRPERPYKCDICNIALSSKPQLLYHKKTIHSIATGENGITSIIPKIELPPPVFIEKSNLPPTTSPLSSNPALPYVCSICNMGFKLPFKLTRHFEMHNDVHRTYSCTQCEKTFRTLPVLRSHINGVHLKLKPYSCQICSRSFSQRGALSSHMVTHTGDKPHTCTYCNKSFGILRQLNVHLRIHTGVKPYRCEICSESFAQQKSLASHQRIKHANFTSCSINELPENKLEEGTSTNNTNPVTKEKEIE